MKAIVLEKIGGIEGFVERDLLLKEPSADEVLIRIRASAFNPVDAKIRTGMSGKQPPLILGADCSGVIERAGSNVKDLKKGDPVIAFVFGRGEQGTYAEYVTVPRLFAALKPKNLSFEEAATLPCVGLTAYRIVNVCSHVRPDASVFVAGATGNVGWMVLQLLKHKGIQRITATSGSKEGAALLKKLGVEEESILFYKGLNLEQSVELLRKKKQGPFSLAIDLAGGQSKLLGIACLEVGGHLVTILPENPSEGAEILSRQGGLFQKSLSLHAINLGSDAANPNPARWISYQKQLEELAGLVEREVLKPCEPKVLGPLSLQSVQEAHRLLDSRNSQGKLVVTH